MAAAAACPSCDAPRLRAHRSGSQRAPPRSRPRRSRRRRRCTPAGTGNGSCRSTGTSTSRAAAATAASGDAPSSRPGVERVRTGAAVDGIERVVNGHVRHRVHARLVERVVVGRDAGGESGLARILVPSVDRIGPDGGVSLRRTRDESQQGRGSGHDEQRPNDDANSLRRRRIHERHGSLHERGWIHAAEGLLHRYTHGRRRVAFPAGAGVRSYLRPVQRGRPPSWRSASSALIEASLDGRPLALGPPQQRAVLAMLALQVNRTVSTDRLIEGLWDERAPPSAHKLVQLYVSHLRKLLDGCEAEIVTRGRGYELHLAADRVDAARFERLVDVAAQDDSSNGAAREALALWHGAALADLADEPFAGAEIRRLEQLRLRAAELAIEADIEAGRHGEVIGELEALVAEDPLRERLHGTADAGALPLRAPGGGADGLPRSARAAGRADRRGARARAAEAARGDPAPGGRARAAGGAPAAARARCADPAGGPRSRPPLAARALGGLPRTAPAGWYWSTGARGIGKTRLVAELAGELHAQGIRIDYVTCAASDGEFAAPLERAAERPDRRWSSSTTSIARRPTP